MKKQNTKFSIHHGELIITYDLSHPETFYVRREPNRAHGIYKLKSTEIVKDLHVSIYKLLNDSYWLPAYITITETDIDIHINHTKSVL